MTVQTASWKRERLIWLRSSINAPRHSPVTPCPVTAMKRIRSRPTSAQAQTRAPAGISAGARMIARVTTTREAVWFRVQCEDMRDPLNIWPRGGGCGGGA